MTADLLVPAHRAAELLDITPHSLRTYRYERRGPRFVRRPNGTVWYLAADLRAHLAEQAERAQREADRFRERLARLDTATTQTRKRAAKLSASVCAEGVAP